MPPSSHIPKVREGPGSTQGTPRGLAHRQAAHEAACFVAVTLVLVGILIIEPFIEIVGSLRI